MRRSKDTWGGGSTRWWKGNKRQNKQEREREGKKKRKLTRKVVSERMSIKCEEFLWWRVLPRGRLRHCQVALWLEGFPMETMGQREEQLHIVDLEDFISWWRSLDFELILPPEVDLSSGDPVWSWSSEVDPLIKEYAWDESNWDISAWKSAKLRTASELSLSTDKVDHFFV